jgi:hypothetical protein
MRAAPAPHLTERTLASAPGRRVRGRATRPVLHPDPDLR